MKQDISNILIDVKPILNLRLVETSFNYETHKPISVYELSVKKEYSLMRC